MSRSSIPSPVRLLRSHPLLRRSVAGCAAGALAVALAPTAATQPVELPIAAQHARVHRVGDLAPLTGPSQAPAPAVVADFVARRVGRSAAAGLALAGSHRGRGGVTHLRFGQRVAGLDVYGAYVKAAVDGEGRLVSVIESLVARPGKPRPAAIGPEEALAAAVRHHYEGLRWQPRVEKAQGPRVDFDDNEGFFWQGPTVTRMAVPGEGGALAEGFLVETWTDEDNQLWHTLVGGDGDVLYQESRTQSDTYAIFPEHPGAGAQTVVSGPGGGNTESPIGWVSTNTTTGNNVDAYLDRDNNNSADAGGRPTSSTQSFEFTADLGQAPTLAVNQQAAVTSLFYWNNVIHDTLYRHGFTESAGNFQQNNFGLGGAGNDRVRAEAQDGGGTNNANFATPADGSAPRMQMYLWTTATPNRDGDLDSDVIWHEYGHGLTWRMIGSMSGPLAGAIGEGMSDVLALYAHGDDTVGEYVANDPDGIRRFPYTDYPLTYGDVDGSSVHADGEIYAAAMWRLRELWLGAGLTQDELYDVVVEGMSFTPSRPAYEDMRDGLLAASPTTAKDCLIWNAFAELGIGEGANGQETCFFGIFCFLQSVTESFAVPATCS